MNKFKNKEGIIALCLAVIHFVLRYYFAYIKFDVNNVKSYNYILGLPEWFFYSSIVVSVLIIILVVILTNLLLNDEIKEEENNDK